MTTVTILADNGASSGTSGLKTSGGNDGTLVLQTTTAGGVATTAQTIGTDQVTTFAQAANLPNTFGFKNRIINGGMVIDQRNAGASVTPSTTTYTLDRWVAYTPGSKFSVQQNAGSVTPPSGFTKYLGVTSTSAYSIGSGDLSVIAQLIEGYNVADLGWGAAGAATVTLSFWVRSSLTGTFGGALSNNGQTRSYPFTYTVNSANTWEQKTVTIAGDTSGTWTTDNTAGIRLFFGIGVGSTYSGAAGSWAGASYLSATGATSVVGTNGATFYITGVQLEKGTAATSFDFRSIGTELALCQRYYQQGFTWIGKFNTTTTFFGYGTYQVEMRAAPTATYIAGGSISEITVADRAVSGIPSYAGNNKGGYFQATVSGATVGNLGANAASAPTVAGFSAEL